MEPQTETIVADSEVQKEAQNHAQKEKRQKKVKKVELRKLRKQKITKLSFQMKPTPSRERT